MATAARVGHGCTRMTHSRAPFRLLFALPVAALLASCGQAEPQPESRTPTAAPRAEAPAPAPPKPGPPPPDASGTSSAEGAVNTLRTYYTLIEAGRYDDAHALRWTKRPDAATFAANFARYAEYHARLGTPGGVLAAGGSFYVDVPVQIFGTLKSGASFGSAGTVTLRRAADGQGSTPEQRRWRIYQ